MESTETEAAVRNPGGGGGVGDGADRYGFKWRNLYLAALRERRD